MPSNATRLAAHGLLIWSKSETFQRLLLIFTKLLWQSSPRLLVFSVFSSVATRALKVLSFLGTLQLAYFVFNPPPRLVAFLQPALDMTGLSETGFIAAASATMIFGIFATAAIVTIIEAHYRDENRMQFERFLSEKIFDDENMQRMAASPKLIALSNLTEAAINALSLSLIIAGIWILLLFISPLIATSMLICASLVFALFLYLGSRSRKKSAHLTTAQQAFGQALKAASPDERESDLKADGGRDSSEKSLVLSRMQIAHDARSTITKFRARLDSITLASTGLVVGIAVLLMVDADVVDVILMLLLVRFFLNYAQGLANQLQRISDQLDVVHWAQTIFERR